MEKEMKSELPSSPFQKRENSETNWRPERWRKGRSGTVAWSGDLFRAIQECCRNARVLCKLVKDSFITNKPGQPIGS